MAETSKSRKSKSAQRFMLIHKILYWEIFKKNTSCNNYGKYFSTIYGWDPIIKKYSEYALIESRKKGYNYNDYFACYKSKGICIPINFNEKTNIETYCESCRVSFFF